MFKKYSLLLRYGIFMILLGLTLTGTECEKLLTGTGSVEGNWTLVKMEGTLQDVCLGETANFSGGIATLQCPGQNSVTKNYTFSNNVLTYTSSGISYDVTFTTANFVEKMVLTAQGSVDRKLTYDRN